MNQTFLKRKDDILNISVSAFVGLFNPVNAALVENNSESFGDISDASCLNRMLPMYKNATELSVEELLADRRSKTNKGHFVLHCTRGHNSAVCSHTNCSLTIKEGGQKALQYAGNLLLLALHFGPPLRPKPTQSSKALTL